MKIPMIGLLRVFVRIPYLFFGNRLGRVRALQFLFRWFISWAVPRQYVLVPANGYRLGMTVGGDRGFDEEAVSLLFGAGYEVKMTELFKSAVKPDMNVVDIGAHIGYYTVLVSRLVGGGWKVWAFEPEPTNYAELLENIKFNQCENVVAVPSAVGSECGIANLYLYGRFSGQRSLVDVGRKHEAIGVEVVSLDEFIGKDRVDVVKIDVDGGEMGVMLGMERLVKENPQIKVFTEVWETGLKDAGHSCIDYWSLLREFGFGFIYLMDEKKGEINRVDVDGLLGYISRFGGVNLFCSRSAIAKDLLL